MKRYNMIPIDACSGIKVDNCYISKFEDPNGKWVKYEDVKHYNRFHELEGAYSTIETLRGEINKLKDEKLSALQDAGSYKTINEELQNRIKRIQNGTEKSVECNCVDNAKITYPKMFMSKWWVCLVYGYKKR